MDDYKKELLELTTRFRDEYKDEKSNEETMQKIECVMDLVEDRLVIVPDEEDK